MEHKKEIFCLIATLLIIFVTFASFVKYNVIGIVIALFIFTSFYKKSVMGRGIIIMLFSVVSLFIANYFLGFFFRSISATVTFYNNHFWGYISGSLIYDDYIFDPGINSSITLEYKLLTFLFAFPNMFLRKLIGGRGLFPHIKKPFLPIGDMSGQSGNVTDAFGYLFPAKGLLIDKVLYIAIIVVLGMLFSSVYIRAKKKRDYYNTFICNFLTYFISLSFFGTFYISPGPWELLIYSLIVPDLFLHATDLKKGIIHLS